MIVCQACIVVINITALDTTRPSHPLQRAHHHVAVKTAHAIVVLGNVMQSVLLASVIVPTYGRWRIRYGPW